MHNKLEFNKFAETHKPEYNSDQDNLPTDTKCKNESS